MWRIMKNEHFLKLFAPCQAVHQAYHRWHHELAADLTIHFGLMLLMYGLTSKTIVCVTTWRITNTAIHLHNQQPNI